MAKQWTIVLSNHLSELDRLHQFLEHVQSEAAFGQKTIFQLGLACDELFTNTVKYGFGDNRDQRFSLQIELHPDELVVEIRDNGNPFNPLALIAPDVALGVEEREIGGLGIHFVRQVMDQVEYKWEEANNVLQMKKKKPHL